MEYTKKQFIADVETEARKLRATASPEELGNLNLDELQFYNKNKCIYGQMTGDCFNDRASELIEACCPRYFKDSVLPTGHSVSPVDFERVQAAVNGTTIDFSTQRDNFHSNHFSAIEAYIAQQGAPVQNLVAYLKGETDEPNLSF